MVVLMNGGINGHSGNSNTFRYESPCAARMQNISPGAANVTMTSASKQLLMDMSRTSSAQPTSPVHASRNVSKISAAVERLSSQTVDSVDAYYGVHEMLASLALMCLLSLLMAFLALFFLQRTGPILTLPDDKLNDSSAKIDRLTYSRARIIDNGKEYIRVFQISVSLSTLTISLNLCCLFVCCIQFLSAIKLLKTPQGRRRTHHFLKKTSHIRVIAIGAFLISIPIFFTGVILFTFINFDELPALTTSVIIGIGIVFCGVASVQNVYLWQCEKTKASQELSASRLSQMRDSGVFPPIELSTLV
ncbi:uncharacterized protein B4U80_05250 [Leptotrombidium deliense]|uniref:Uncharacterized protein n=1 Tax=Leptotrombidium deliense TaxID=299467 RepID=A0A443SBM7_9ACAR|nr:uncharacterized protein B4U80_05250 [Leptotrombidium deliense]